MKFDTCVQKTIKKKKQVVSIKQKPEEELRTSSKKLEKAG